MKTTLNPLKNCVQIFLFRILFQLVPIWATVVCTPAILNAQASVELARYLGGNGEEKGVGSVTMGNNIYIWATTTSSNLPVTNGSFFHGGSDVYVAKLNSSGTILFGSYIGGSEVEEIHNLLGTVDQDHFYLAFTTYSADLVTTDGSVYGGMPGSANIALAKIDATTGVTNMCCYGGVFPIGLFGMKLSGGDMFIGAVTSMFDPPMAVTNGSVYNGGSFDIALARFSGTTGQKVWAGYWGSAKTDLLFGMEVEGNSVHLLSYSDGTASSQPSTNATDNNGAYDMVYAKISVGNGATSFLTYLGGSSNDEPICLKVRNGEAYILGGTYSSNFPSTTGAQFKGNRDAIVTKFRSDGSIAYSTIIGGSGNDGYGGNSFEKQLDILNGEVAFLVSTEANGYPVTNGSVASASDLAVTKLNSTGQIIFSSFLGSPSSDYAYDVKLQCDEVYVAGSFGPGLPTTNGTSSSSTYNTGIAKFSTANGRLIYSSYFAATADLLTSFDFSIVGNGIIQMTQSLMPNALSAVTIPGNSYGGGPSDGAVIRINTSLTGFSGSTIVSPGIQTICANASTSVILMDACIVPGSSLLPIYVNGNSSTQADVLAQRYQWQVAATSSGPWTDLPGANGKNLTPPTGALTRYYRRLSFHTPACGVETLIQTGDIAEVIVNSNNAPTINAGGPFVTCPGTAVTLGGSPTATANAGSSIVSYLWTPGNSFTPSNAVANPQVSPTVTTIYSVVVTDDKGCQQTAQALVNVYSANAGNAKSVCGGQAVRIGTSPLIGVGGVTYAWTASPADATMNCTNCAQPDVHPSVNTTYTLTQTIPVTGGGTCTSTSSVLVSVVAPPLNNGGAFGGADVTICSGAFAALGTNAEPGFSYTWSPGAYLSANTGARPLFMPGSPLPITNPMRYYVTATKGSCSFVDSVDAYVLKPNAGADGCGPRLIGTADATPQINEIYSWTKISSGAGTSNFIGATNLPQVPVSNATVATTYRLTVTHNGISCSDDVVVSPCGGCITPAITVTAPSTCPSFTASGGQVTLTASSPIAVIYSWSPAAGLSATSGASVSLTDNIPRTYTVTATSIVDPTFVCTNTIEVNNTAWVAPVFNAQQVSVCPGTPINIGAANVAGYSYLWSGNGLNATNISDPIATVVSSTFFPVIVTDAVTGCTTNDTAEVTVHAMPQNVAGNDITICGSGTVQLGTSPVAGVNYLWTPVAGYMPDNTAANPTVAVSATTTYHVEASNVQGCTTSGDITVTVNPAVAPFSFVDQLFCPSDIVEIALPAGPAGMDKYSWSPATDVINPDWNGPIATTLATLPSAIHSYTLTVTNASGCTGQALVRFVPATSVPDAGANKVICLSDGSVRLGNASNAVGPGITYSWSPAADLSDPADPNPLFTPTTAGTTTFILTKEEAGCITQATVTVVVNDFVLPALASTTICANSCLQIGLTPAAGVIYNWSPAAGLSDPDVANPVACPAATTTYTLRAVDANGCYATQTSIISIHPTSAPAVTVSPINICVGAGGNTLNATVNPSVGNYLFEWTPGNGTLSNVYAQNPYVLSGGFGTRIYDVKVTDQASGCYTIASGQVDMINCVFLPIKFQSFTAIAKNYEVNLDWLVQEFKNIHHYEVEHSTDGRKFFKIADVEVGYRSTQNFVHHSPSPGKNYYRIKLVEKGGQSTQYSPVRMVSLQNEEQERITLYPNPANQMVAVILPSVVSGTPAGLEIYDMNAKLVFQNNRNALQSTELLDVSRLSNGMYVVVVRSSKGVYRVKLLIKR